MKAETLKRLFRLIQDASNPGLSTLAAKIVEDEKRVGHTALAAQLEKILAEAKKTAAPLTGKMLSSLLQHRIVSSSKELERAELAA